MAFATTKPGDSPKPAIITLGGLAGTGKSTLAALFTPGLTLWVPVEDSSATFEAWDRSVQPDFLDFVPQPDKAKNISARRHIMAICRQLEFDDHGYDGGTVVFDSVSVMHKFFEEELCQKENKDNVEECSGGFQKCYVVLGRWHQEFIEACKRIRNKRNMTVVFTTHTEIRKIRNKPDAEEHTIWDMNMAAKCASFYIDQSDAVLYLRIEELIKGRETNGKGQVTKLGKSASNGKRMLITSSEGNTGFTNAKNRWSLPPKIEVEQFQNPLLTMIPYYGGSIVTAEE